ncbi:hypothetical protein ETD83_08460 [Actinomadura soli]|uniref:IstB-like ATP-binding domain-containing protein n=2 Tax=Actinomadura soli TaxID=2508997 RepID=A0A5C4JGL2_9ACTN|nr:hypothetical protein ETD83_08460 [Actinomadura soli]
MVAEEAECRPAWCTSPRWRHAGRGSCRSERRIKAAAFPSTKSWRAFDFEANPNIAPAVIHSLATCEWVHKGQPPCLIGDSGTNKSHLCAAIVDRLTYNGAIIETGTDSYRPAQIRARAEHNAR